MLFVPLSVLTLVDCGLGISVASLVMVMYTCVMGFHQLSADGRTEDECSSEALVDAYLADLIAEVGDPSPDEIAAAEAVARRIRARGSDGASDS